MNPPPVQLVIDANVAVKLCVREDLTDKAEELFTFLDRDPRNRFYVPDFLYAEVANVLWKYVTRGEMAADKAQSCLAEILRLPLSVVASQEVVARALELSIRYGIAAYDGSYQAIAERVGASLVTVDEPLLRKLRGSNPPALDLVSALRSLRAATGQG